MKILKFGGTSVGSADSIKKTVEILKGYRNRNIDFAVVFSAMTGITNDIITVSNKAAQHESAYLEDIKIIEDRHITAVKSLIDVKVQSKVVANVKILLNELEDILHGVFLLRELSLRSQDLLLSFGERL